MTAPHPALYDPIFGQDEAFWRATSPLENLSGRPAALLLVCEKLRKGSCDQAEHFAAAARALGGSVTVGAVMLSHEAVSAVIGKKAPIADTIDAFLAAFGVG